MFKGTFSGTSVANTNIPLTTVFNTNSNISYSNGTIQLTKAGYYDIKAMAQITAGTTGDVTFNIIGAGSILQESSNKQTVATGDDYTFVATDVVKVLSSAEGTANISIQFDTAGETINSGVVIVGKRS